MIFAINTHGSFLYILREADENYSGTWYSCRSREGDQNFRRFTAPTFNITKNTYIEVSE